MSGEIVVTGLGVISPIGIGVSEFWKAALDGRSGISAIAAFDPFPMDGYRSKVAGQIHGFSPERYLDSIQAERVDRYAQFALVAAKEALADSGLQMAKENPRRIGVIVGAGMGGMVMGEREITQLYQSQRPHRVHPNFIPVITLNSASGIVAMAHGAKGPNYTISTACSSSAHALGQAMQCIKEGRADVVVTVGADASITPLVFAGFCSLRALSTKYNDQPERASRPFDRQRDGFVMGEGAGALVLESSAHARKRRARIYAEVAGYAATSEAYHMVIPREDGEEIAATMRLAMDVAALEPVRIPSSIPPFVRLADDLRKPIPFGSQLPNQLIAQLRMLLDQGPFFLRQTTGLCDDRRRNGEESDVVDQAGKRQSFQFLAVVAQTRADFCR